MQTNSKYREKIFIGTQLNPDGRRVAVLRMINEKGTLCISEEGVMNNDNSFFAENLDSSFPMKMIYKAGANTKSIRKATLSITLEKFRTYSKAIGIGGATTSELSPQLTSSDGGSYSNSFGATSSDGLGYIATYTDVDNPCVDPAHPNETKHNHMISVQPDAFAHSHSVTTVISVPSHIHSIPAHNHEITGHNHVLEMGIWEGTKASEVSVYVNDNLVESGINADCEVDITNYLEVNTDNIIKITSATLGRISCNIWTSVWNLWD